MSFALAIAAAVLAACASRASAQWLRGGTPICAAPFDQRNPQLIADGSSGAIIAWEDDRNESSDWDIYAQRVDAKGVALWTANGVPICTARGIQSNCRLAPDGLGGAIVVWEDHLLYLRSRLFAQRIDASGRVLWAGDGVPVATAWGQAIEPQIISDGSGGAIITWMDSREDTYHVYAQRIDATGVVQWVEDGVVVCAVIGTEESPSAVSDGAGGAVIVWNDNRKECYCENDIYAQRIDGTGNVLWAKEGVALSAARGEKGAPGLVADGSGGAIVAWEDERGSVYSQRVNAEGTALWTTDGVPLCQAPGGGLNPAIASDDAGGAIVTWEDYRAAPGAVRHRAAARSLDERTGLALLPGSHSKNPDIYAQRIDRGGNLLWGADAAPVCTVAGFQYMPVIASDSTGAIIAWLDGRYEYYSLYGQRVRADGTTHWAAGGAPICTADRFRFSPEIAAEGGGKAIIAWQDYRNGGYDIYAEEAESDGIEPLPVAVVLGQNYPNPFNARTSIEFAVPARSRVNLEIFDVTGRRIARLIDQELERGTYTATWASIDDRGKAVASGIYFYRLRVGDSAISKKLVLLK